jgi:hypothetical protein
MKTKTHSWVKANRWKLLSRCALAALVVTLGMGGRISSAHADQLLKATTTMLYGSAADTYSFTTPGAGVVTAQVASVPWPTPLSALSFSVSDGSSTLAHWSSTDPTPGMATPAAWSPNTPQVETFRVSGTGTYFANVLAKVGTANNPLNLGLYSVMLTFSPVPLPTAAGLFLIGIAVLIALRGTLRGPRNESVMYPA